MKWRCSSATIYVLVRLSNPDVVGTIDLTNEWKQQDYHIDQNAIAVITRDLTKTLEDRVHCPQQPGDSRNTNQASPAGRNGAESGERLGSTTILLSGSSLFVPDAECFLVPISLMTISVSASDHFSSSSSFQRASKRAIFPYPLTRLFCRARLWVWARSSFLLTRKHLPMQDMRLFSFSAFGKGLY